jgi:hypothetical protein
MFMKCCQNQLLIRTDKAKEPSETCFLRRKAKNAFQKPPLSLKPSDLMITVHYLIAVLILKIINFKNANIYEIY